MVEVDERGAGGRRRVEQSELLELAVDLVAQVEHRVDRVGTHKVLVAPAPLVPSLLAQQKQQKGER